MASVAEEQQQQQAAAAAAVAAMGLASLTEVGAPATHLGETPIMTPAATADEVDTP